MARNTFILLAIVIALLTGCHSLGRLDKDVSVGPNETIYVFGAAPASYYYNVVPISFGNGGYNIKGIASFFGRPENGYLVGKTSDGGHLALDRIKATPDMDSYLGPMFAPCGGKNGLVFEAIPGKVVYITDAIFSLENGSIRVAYQDNYEVARQYVDNNYPLLKGKLERGAYKFIPSNELCTQAFYITVPKVGGR